MDNIYALELAIGAHKLGYVSIAAVDDDDPGQGIGFYRELLDIAGLNHVPLVQTPSAEGIAFDNCYSSTTVPAFNASVSMNVGNYPGPVSIYRQIFANLTGGQKVAMMYGGPVVDLYDLLQSPADGISTQTGQQMFNNDVLEVNMQGGNILESCSNCDNLVWGLGRQRVLRQ